MPLKAFNSRVPYFMGLKLTVRAESLRDGSTVFLDLGA